MTKTRVIYDNAWRKGTIIAESSEHPQFPSTDTQGDTPSQFWRTPAGNNSNESISVDLLTAKTVTFLAILNHNIDANATIKWRVADDANFSANLVEVTITHNPTNIYYFLGANYTAQRYAQLSLVDGANPNTYFQVGPILAGNYWEVGREVAIQYTKGKVDSSLVDESYSLVEYAQPKPLRKTWTLPYSGLNDSDADVIISFFEETGLSHGFVLCLDANSPNSYSHFVRNMDLVEPQYNYHDHWDWALRVMEKL